MTGGLAFFINDLPARQASMTIPVAEWSARRVHFTAVGGHALLVLDMICWFA